MMSRRHRRAARALGIDREQTVTCTTCKGVVWKGPMGRSLAARAREVHRAFVAHCRISGCLKAEDIESVSLPE